MNIKGSFSVRKTNFWTPNIEYRVVFVDDQLLFIKTASQMSWEFLASILGVISLSVSVRLIHDLHRIPGTLAIVAIFAAVGLGCIYVSYLLAKKKKIKTDLLLDSFTYKSVEDLIQADKKSFIIPYSEILLANIKKYYPKGLLRIKTTQTFKFDIIDQQPIAYIEALVASIAIYNSEKIKISDFEH
jgi:hypothetical protein